MSRKIASSKYKHAVAKAGKNDTWYTDLQVASAGGAEASGLISASCQYIAFPYGSGGGGSIGILNVSKPGKYDKDLSVISAHGSGITDLDFSPFYDEMLVSGSEDTQIKLWTIPEGFKQLSSPTTVLSGHSRRVEAVRFHPNAHQVVASAAGSEVKIWNAETSTAQLTVPGHSEIVHSLSWKGDGTLLATTSKDTKVRVIDPRASSVVQETVAHQGVKASAVKFLGDLGVLVTTGFTKTREREFAIWDARNLSSSLVRETVDNSTGVLVPLFDEDTNILMFAGKGDGTIRWYEFQNEKNKYLTWPGTTVVTDVPQRGVTLLPKRALDVMQGEVARVLKLTQNAVVPIGFQVPRKTYMTFHDDLYPDTRSDIPALTVEAWFGGSDGTPAVTPLDPARKKVSRSPDAVSATTAKVESVSISSPSDSASPAPAPVVSSSPALTSSPSAVPPSSSPSPSAPSSTPTPTVTPVEETRKYKSVIRESKFRYITGKALHPSNNYTHLNGLSAKLLGETDAFTFNQKFMAIPLNNPGGQIGIIPVGRFGRQPTKIAAVVNGAEMQDFTFSPFDPNLLAVACDDSSIRLWHIPDGGLADDIKEPLKKLSGHSHRVNIIGFHPLASDILVSASPELNNEGTIKYWDLTTGQNVLTVTGFKDLIFSFAHNYDGSLLAAVSKDGRIRVIDPRANKIISEGPSHDGSRGARVVWLGKTGRLASIGFDKSSQRELRIFDSTDLSKPLAIHSIDISPSVLVPYFDEDTSVLFLWGRGDTSISFFEIVDEAPYAYYLTRFDGASPQIGVGFLPKTSVDVKKVEIAICHRLLATHIETISFTVPRTKLEYFQEDLFPPTRSFAKPSMSSSEWLNGGNVQVPLINLQPEGMKPVSQAPVEVKVKKFESRKPNELSEEEKREKVLNNLFQNVKDEVSGQPLKQDLMEGVDESEWD